ncbi:response regulator [Gracilibacillus sp. YIM 98692]|uniref:response regulator n=1 Tax=Gracilibacillus sp. YIM 98692 TaxID=2663532 RepID=UPI0013D88615|nr:response regulator [Gracilibacillus sp. YIM 98692]
MRKIRTIIIEDEAKIRRGIERMLRQSGDEWEVVNTFSDGEKVLHAIEKNDLTFDLLITDVKMPKMDGLTLIKSLKKMNFSFIPVIISGFNDVELLQDALREGAVDYLIKPINRNHFKEQMQKVKSRIIEKRNMESQLQEIEEKDAKLSYANKVYQLSEVTWKKETDLSLMQWTQQFPDGYYLLLYASIDNLADKEKTFKTDERETWRFTAENIIDELTNEMKQRKQCWWWRGEKISYWILIRQQVVEDDIDLHGHKTAELIKKSIQKYTPFTFTVAISNKFSDLLLLSNARDQLLSLIQNRLVHGGNRIYSPSTVKKLQQNGDQSMLPTDLYPMIQHLVIAVEKRLTKEIESHLQQFFVKLKQLQSPVLITKAIHVYFITLVNQLISNNEMPQLSIEDILYKVRNATDFSLLKSEVINWTKQLVRNKEMNPRLDHVQVAKDWVKNHLKENITITKVAEQVYMNPNYFCEVFKNQTGETVLDYVTRVRIEKAKELLVQSNMKVYDIASEVGYKDNRYFSRLFKQHIGEVPSKYRELYNRS